VRSCLSVAGWLGLSIVVLAVAACGHGPPAPSMAILEADPSLAARALVAAQGSFAQRGLSVSQGLSVGSGHIVVSAKPSQDKGALPFVSAYWVVAVQLASRAREISMAQLRDAVAGRSADWTRVLVPADAPSLDQWWPDMTPVTQPMSVGDIPAALAADPRALALLPLEGVDARVRSLTVDGVNIVFGTGDLSAYGLAQHGSIMTRDSRNKRFDDAVASAAKDMASVLDVPTPDPIIMRSTGDVIPSRCAYAKQRDYGDYRHAFLKLGPWLAQADITTGSVDATLSDVSPPFGCIDTFNLAAPAASIDGLAYAGYDVITVAANHAKDCGQVGACGDQALLATLANLRSHGIQPVGGGVDLADARKPVVLTVKGVRFAFLGYDDIAEYYHATADTAGTAPLDEAYVREDVAAAATHADVVIVMPHWGVEYTSDPTERQRTLAGAALESGATMVIGNHPHWVQAVQATHRTFVTYSLGNFVFDQDWSLETQQGAVLEAAFHGSQLKGIEVYPVHIFDQHQPAFADPDEAQQILDRIWQASARLP
jgi:poly-gamma-glutamate capsule biosynthesis protein CapA/YwtB (metallophosphatase superfamily)